jgi:hypothetical protein
MREQAAARALDGIVVQRASAERSVAIARQEKKQQE